MIGSRKSKNSLKNRSTTLTLYLNNNYRISQKPANIFLAMCLWQVVILLYFRSNEITTCHQQFA